MANFLRRHGLALAGTATLLGLGGCGDEPPATRADAAADVAAPDTTPDAETSDTDPDTSAETVEPTADQLAVLAVEESARWALPGLSGDVHVLRTEGNIPHIYAQNRLDLMHVAGFIQASDRFFFMDLQRRLGLGTLSALLGDVALEQDIEARGTGITAIVDRLDAHISDDFRAYLGAFADGVNAYIEAVRAGDATPPTETDFAPLLGYEEPADMMAPFAVRDLLALIAVVMHSTNFESGDVGRDLAWERVGGLFEGALKQELRRDGYFRDFFDDVRALFPGTNSTDGFGLTGEGPRAADGDGRRPKRAAAAEGARRARAPVELLARLAERLEARERRAGKDREAGFGSNVWAVAASHAEDGWAILANDGHLELSVPPLAYGAGLNTKVFSSNDPHPPMHQMGGWLGNFPVLIGGTNGDVAFGGVNPVLDITDWYREELRVAEGGVLESYFDGTWRPLRAVTETYEVAEVALLESEGRTETRTRYETFDGRWLTDIEGRVLAEGEAPAEGETVVDMLGTRVVLADLDADGVLSGVSFDYVGLDATRWPEALFAVGMSKNVEEARQAMRGFVGAALFMSVVDSAGNIMYTTYQAVPCRGYLEREGGVFAEGADPTRLLDGTRYGGFTIVSDADGRADETAGEADPYKCVIPADTMPHAINPEAGYVFNANSDPAGLTDDGDERNDAWYVGGPWASVRANTIRRGLDLATADKATTVADMTALQANVQSRLGETFAPYLRAAIAKAAAAEAGEGAEGRLAELHAARSEVFADVATRLEAWGARGFHAASGVETFYHAPTGDDRADAIATMIFNAWFPRFMSAVWDDEGITAWRWGSENRVTATARILEGRGAGNPLALASYDPDTEEAVFFDRLGTEVVESSDELLLSALAAALDFLASEPIDTARGGFGTTDMEAWLWGLRHQVRFESILAPFLAGAGPLASIGDLFSITTERIPLADGLDAADPRADLKWFPRPGDQWAVDAANPGFSGTDFTYGAGPAMRLVLALKGGEVKGEFILPGGQSGVTASPHFDDQARLWLGNETYPVHFAPADVAAAAIGREVYAPPAE